MRAKSKRIHFRETERIYILKEKTIAVRSIEESADDFEES